MMLHTYMLDTYTERVVIFSVGVTSVEFRTITQNTEPFLTDTVGTSSTRTGSFTIDGRISIRKTKGKTRQKKNERC